jgi:hypothetical protein
MDIKEFNVKIKERDYSKFTAEIKPKQVTKGIIEFIKNKKSIDSIIAEALLDEMKNNKNFTAKDIEKFIKDKKMEIINDLFGNIDNQYSEKLLAKEIEKSIKLGKEVKI